jgi:two-component system nitrogen regulation sensor histidine kinase NtrY
MTSQLESQRREVVEANEQLDTRRRFMEAVLSGVSAGVIGLDVDGRLNFPNRSASALLSTNLDKRVGTDIAEIVPEMSELLQKARKRPSRLVESQIELVRRGVPRTLLVRIAVERDGKVNKGFVVTFDDITELLAAQRTATWADVARRLAHEVKNPLTPIQLSAERLRRKYLGQITRDPETFDTCIDTIIRQVDDIGGMIDEFSAFARMPAAALRPRDLCEILNRAIFLQQGANSEIEYVCDIPEHEVALVCDSRQIGQALTNLLQNAADSIAARKEQEGSKSPAGEVRASIGQKDGRISVTVADNGTGLPKNLRKEITDPYVTTRANGTGLGLAIVKRIMEDHRGEVVLSDRKEGGAMVQLNFTTSDARTGRARGKTSGDAPKMLKTAAHDS